MHRLQSLCLAALLGTMACQSESTSFSAAAPSTPMAKQASTAARTPRFLRPAPNAPTIATPAVSFYAKRGVTRQVLMLYHAPPGETDSTVFVRFKVGAKSLLARPNGSRIAPGDSVRITLTLVDPDALIVDFQPAGLRFDPREPAELRMSFAETDPDVSGDGTVNRQDTRLTRMLKIWREETITAPWMTLPSDLFIGAHEVEAPVAGFTRYVVAY